MAGSLEIIYDDECPFCSDYVHLLRLRQSVGTITLTNARELGARGQDLLRQGFNLDDGMMVLYGGRRYIASDAANLLAMLAAPGGGLFVRLVHWLVRTPRRSRWGYPLLRTGRNLMLSLRGKSQINTK